MRMLLKMITYVPIHGISDVMNSILIHAKNTTKIPIFHCQFVGHPQSEKKFETNIIENTYIITSHIVRINFLLKLRKLFKNSIIILAIEMKIAEKITKPENAYELDPIDTKKII